MDEHPSDTYNVSTAAAPGICSTISQRELWVCRSQQTVPVHRSLSISAKCRHFDENMNTAMWIVCVLYQQIEEDDFVLYADLMDNRF